MALPNDAKERKALPMARGLLDYFPDALAEVANVSRVGNDQHNPGQPIHWAKHLSTDHADCLMRHLLDRGTLDLDRLRHSAKVAWRALALLQTELEAEAQGVSVDVYIELLKDTAFQKADDAKGALRKGGFDVVAKQPCACNDGYCISHVLETTGYYCKHPDQGSEQPCSCGIICDRKSGIAVRGYCKSERFVSSLSHPKGDPA